ncbi:hypothetical protein HG263_17660 [Pseudoalteromonas sp. JBTF-M23]|uniref:Formyl transferase C-terminal domain-containing protein n=1 Tax=Pseudoalteromonas caenipelagi TaxID=2726988 RepID=A0A849VKX6_9GAMM|nr:hypothetical protein [Pseudoalteromonas caenipelagi]NOU52351.1 hypothetical protein [Pseudoalteromonas caenipelagi]
MKKIILITCSTSAIPAIECLVQMQALAGVLITHCAESQAQQLAAVAQHFSLPSAFQATLDADFINSAEHAWQAENFVSFHLPFALLQDLKVEQDIIQVQFGEHSNATIEHALFDAIKKQADSCALIVASSKHMQRLSEYQVAVEENDTAGTLHKKLMAQLPNVLSQLVMQFDSQHKTEQTSQFAPKALAQLDESHLFIDLQTDNAAQIVSLARAANPYFGGARLRIGQVVCQLLQASVSTQPTFGVKAGTILTLSKTDGLVIALNNQQALKLDIVSCNEGIFDGYRFAMQAKLQAGMILN